MTSWERIGISDAALIPSIPAKDSRQLGSEHILSDATLIPSIPAEDSRQLGSALPMMSEAES
jgi:hypothetical protein